MAEQPRRFTVGYALAPKKVSSFIQPSLVDHAKQRGIDLVRIDLDKPLIEQGPFDCIIHKMNDEDWKNQMEEFSTKNPNVVIIDPPDAIEQLHSRISMLEVVKDLKIPEGTESFGIPKQIVIYDPESLLDSKVLDGLSFPVIAKPLVADGSAKSHKMSLAFNGEGLKKLTTPIVLQEFVNHGGVIFKVYVVGDHVTCVKRRSLPDVSAEKLGTSEGLLTFSQISNLTATQEPGENDCEDIMNHVEEAEMPPLNFVNEIAIGLRKAMGLNLFNFDVIRDAKLGNRYLVIDINYFPGYAKMPSYETVLTDFFWDIVHRKSLGMKDFEQSGSDCRKSDKEA